MRILYAAKHNQTTNTQDDEGAITHALRELGHAVYTLDEKIPSLASPQSFDLMLCHRISEKSELLSWSKGRHPVACWYFDQVNSAARRFWIDAMRRRVDYLFVTDGDYQVTAPDDGCPVILLRQGADERWWASEPKGGPDMTGKVLMTASIGKSEQRVRQIIQLKTKLGDRFVHYKKGLYGDSFRRAVSTADMVIAPEWPSTDRYWSNRVYVTLAAGGLLLHPTCADLTRIHGGEYRDGRHLFDYLRSDVFSTFDQISRLKLDTEYVKQEGRKHTFENHLYRHRLQILINTVLNEGRTQP